MSRRSGIRRVESGLQELQEKYGRLEGDQEYQDWEYEI